MFIIDCCVWIVFFYGEEVVVRYEVECGFFVWVGVILISGNFVIDFRIILGEILFETGGFFDVKKLFEG